MTGKQWAQRVVRGYRLGRGGRRRMVVMMGDTRSARSSVRVGEERGGVRWRGDGDVAVRGVWRSGCGGRCIWRVRRRSVGREAAALELRSSVSGALVCFGGVRAAGGALRIA